MMIVMTPHATAEQIDSVLAHVKSEGFSPHRSDGKEYTVIGVVGIVDRDADPRLFELLDGVAKVVRISSPFKLASRQFQEADTIVDCGKGVKIGGPDVVLMAGPCTIENRERSTPSRPSSPTRAPRSCAAARSSRAPRPTRFKAWARRGSRSCARPPIVTSC